MDFFTGFVFDDNAWSTGGQGQPPVENEDEMNLEFLNLDDATEEERWQIESLINPNFKRPEVEEEKEEEEKPQEVEETQNEPQTPTQQQTPSQEQQQQPDFEQLKQAYLQQQRQMVQQGPVATSSFHMPFYPMGGIPPFPIPQQQTQQQPQQPQTPQQTPPQQQSPYLMGPHTMPFSNVYINNVTANVNVPPHYNPQQPQPVVSSVATSVAGGASPQRPPLPFSNAPMPGPMPGYPPLNPLAYTGVPFFNQAPMMPQFHQYIPGFTPGPMPNVSMGGQMPPSMVPQVPQSLPQCHIPTAMPQPPTTLAPPSPGSLPQPSFSSDKPKAEEKKAEEEPTQQPSPPKVQVEDPPQPITSDPAGIMFGDFSPTEVGKLGDNNNKAVDAPELDKPVQQIPEKPQPPPLSSNQETAPVPQPQQQVVNQEQPTQQKPPQPAAAAPPPQNAWANSGPKSWASLFSSGGAAGAAGVPIPPNNNNEAKGKLTAVIQPYSDDSDKMAAEAGEGQQTASSSAVSSSVSKDLAEFLRAYVLNHKTASYRPRGLTNRSNWCFVNSVLQALTACPPFYNLMKVLPLMKEPQHEFIDKDLTRLNATWQFFQEFEIMSSFPRLNRGGKARNKMDDLPTGKAFEAASVYQMLLSNAKDTFKVVEGRQEDAEEFLSFLLNGINDEMISVIKTLNLNEDAAEVEEGQEEGQEDEEDGWKEVGPKNKGVVTRRQSQQCTKTPLAGIFQGQIRSSVNKANSEPTATLQPFFSLQLDVQGERTTSLKDALEANFATETLDGFVDQATKQEVAATRSLSLEELPATLVLHLKRFVYDEKKMGCQKILKNVEYPVQLEIPRDILSTQSRSRYSHQKSRSYKLFAVVYHNGNEATKGHYVTDLYHTALSTWLHFDDGTAKAVPEGSVLNPAGNSTPYILFYRRSDTIGTGATPAAAGGMASPVTVSK